MPDYIYLLENRLSIAQQSALKLIREAARDAQMTVFLTGGAVRDLTSGSPVRDLDISVQGNVLNLQKAIEDQGGIFWGSDTASRTLFFRFPGGVRAEISSTRRVVYPKPGQPVYHWDNILDDLHRRDFTANAMALSLNEGSYGLLMDPMNGVADIEARQLRLVSNYGFMEEPARLIRATRLVARLGWELDEKTKARFDNAMIENMVEALSPWQAAYELEEIGHEEDALKILKAMEDAGWMKHLFPAWTTAKADVAALEQLREVLIQLQMQGVNPDISAASMELLTAKMAPKEIAAMKAMFVRRGFADEWDNLDAAAKEFGKVLTSKQASTPSAIWKLFASSNPDAVLWLGLTAKGAAIQEKYKNFFTVWPEARQKIPYTLMQEMRITPELPGYQDLLQNLFYEFIDGRLQTEEELKAFLEPFSPPAPPPPVMIRRARASKKSEGRGKAKLKDIVSDEDGEEEEDEDDDDADTPDETPGLEPHDLPDDEPADEDDDEDDDEDEDEAPVKSTAKKSVPKSPLKSSHPEPDKASALAVVEKSPAKRAVAQALDVPQQAGAGAAHKGSAKPGAVSIAAAAVSSHDAKGKANGSAAAHPDVKHPVKLANTDIKKADTKRSDTKKSALVAAKHSSATAPSKAHAKASLPLKKVANKTALKQAKSGAAKPLAKKVAKPLPPAIKTVKKSPAGKKTVSRPAPKKTPATASRKPAPAPKKSSGKKKHDTKKKKKH